MFFVPLANMTDPELERVADFLAKKRGPACDLWAIGRCRHKKRAEPPQ